MKFNWQTKKLIDVCTEITDGSHFSPKSNECGEYPYVTVRDITNDFIDFSRCKYINKIDYLNLLKNGCKPHKGNVLFSKDGTVGKVSLVDFEKDFVVLSSLAILRTKENIVDSTFLKYQLKSPTFLNTALGKKTGVAIRRIILKNLKNIPIFYPPLPEQQRIVKILDEVFEKIAKAKENTEKNLQNSKELFESCLQDIFKSSDEDWEERRLGDIYDVRDGTHDSPKYHKEGYALITSKNLKKDELNDKNIRYISEKDYRKINDRSKVDKGDVLFAMIGTIGNPVVVKIEPNFAIKNVALLKVPKEQNNYFLKYFLDSKFVIDKMMKEAKGTTQKFVGLGYLRDFKIKLPKLPEQNSIVAKLDALSAQTKKLEENYKKKLENLEELKKSVLKKAFAGGL